MNVPVWVWTVTLIAILVVVVVDLLLVDRGGPKIFSMRQAATWVTFYITLATLFGAGLWLTVGADYAAQFASGYITEYSLSVDNLFIFYVIMSRFAVPRGNQHKVLLFGIVLALIMRGIFIAIGAAAVARFDWLFYFFGAFLIWTAWGLVRSGLSQEDEDFKENALLRFTRRRLRTTDEYNGSKLTVKVNGKRLFTPMLVVMVAIGTTDLLFALDSIPAIFGLTKEPYFIFTANAFALMGLRQLYFLLGGLLERLVYLSYGLAFILGFIGVKLVLEAMHGSGIHWAPEIPIWVSLTVIGTTMSVTTVASLLRSRREPSSRKPPVAPVAEAAGANPASETASDADSAAEGAAGADAPDAGASGDRPGQGAPRVPASPERGH